MTDETDDLTATAIAEETAGPATSVAPVPEKPPEEPAADATASPTQAEDDFIGSFAEPDYIDVVSDKDRMAEEEAPADTSRPLDPVIPPPAPVEVPAVAAPTPPVTSAPQSEVPPAAPVAAIPAAPVAPEVPAAPTPGVQPSPEEQAAAQARLQEEVLAGLVKLYTFTPEEAAKLDEFEQKPSEYLPKLLAKAHQQAFVQAYEAVMSAMPTVVDRISTVKIAERQAEDAFLSRWPDLREHPQVAVKAIQTFKQMNPNATLEESIERAGMLAMISIGKMPGSTPAAPSAPETPTPPPPRPVVPGGGSGLRRTGPATYEEAVFEEIIRDERDFGRG